MNLLCESEEINFDTIKYEQLVYYKYNLNDWSDFEVNEDLSWVSEIYFFDRDDIFNYYRLRDRSCYVKCKAL